MEPHLYDIILTKKSPADSLSVKAREDLLKRVAYEGSGHHKLNPTQHGLDRVSPRKNSSVCDSGRSISKAEAKELLDKGIRDGLISEIRECGFPKYVWSVSGDGAVFEAKTDAHGSGIFHGYPLEVTDYFRESVLDRVAKK